MSDSFPYIAGSYAEHVAFSILRQIWIRRNKNGSAIFNTQLISPVSLNICYIITRSIPLCKQVTLLSKDNLYQQNFYFILTEIPMTSKIFYAIKFNLLWNIRAVKGQETSLYYIKVNCRKRKCVPLVIVNLILSIFPMVK